MTATLFFVAASMAAPGLKEKPKADTNIVGIWQHVELWYDGKPHKTAVTQHVFGENGRWDQTDDKGNIIAAVSPRFTINAKQSPIQIDIDNKPGIMKIEGDTLTICYNSRRVTDTRPTEFTTSENNGWYMYEMKPKPPKKD